MGKENNIDRIQIIRGMRDIAPEESPWWQWMERTITGVLDRFGYSEIRTPLLEQSRLFKRSIGEDSDIVEKEMYTFEDRDGTKLTLRPEGTASVVRAYIESARWSQEPVSRLYYLGPMFRHERPQKGRYRQFSQVGVELIGAAEPYADVELIDLAVECTKALGLTGTSLQLNSLGCQKCRPAYRSRLLEYLNDKADRLCEKCRVRMQHNPLRVLDCKIDSCVKVAMAAPKMVDLLCTECREHFQKVQMGLELLDIPFQLNHRMVRGLDYYTRTTFEVLAEGLGAQNTVTGGGRYDGLIQTLGGPEVPAIGFATGLDRVLLKLKDLRPIPQGTPGVFVVTHGEHGWRAALRIMSELRCVGLRVESDVRGGSMKSQMKRADRSGARFVVLLGEDEISAGAATVKDLSAAPDDATKQVRVPAAELGRFLRQRLSTSPHDAQA
jgi:histidyl-tRNA synthetase